MSAPEISVVVPVYNTQQYLEQCLGTIVRQTFRSIELICVNDGSTDDSPSILQKFASRDERVIIINREEASGSAALPRNTGLEIANGKYVIFLDSDDYFDETMLEKLYAAAEKNDAELVMCDNYVVSSVSGELDDKHTELHQKYLPKQQTFSYQDIPNTIFQISNAAGWHRLVLRDLLVRNNLKYQLGAPILDDIYFVNMCLILAERVSVIRDRLVYYRAYRDGAQTSGIEKHKDSIYIAFKALNDSLKCRSLYEPIKFSLQNWTIQTMAWWLHSIGDYKVYCDLYDLYQKEYFEKLGLLGIVADSLYDGFGRFYERMLGKEFEPSLRVILESILKPGSKIVVYGAGKVGRDIYQVVKTHGKHTITRWCDKNYAKLDNLLITNPEGLRHCDFDALFIAIADYEIVDQVKEYLINMGINANKIYGV